MKNLAGFGSALLLLGLPVTLRAEIQLGSLFADHMVLQRGVSVPIWGQGESGEKVAVSFCGQQAATIVGPDGKWQVRLGPFPASTLPAELVVKGANTLRVKDVLIGEVWLCSGQSNMAFTVGEAMNARNEMAAAELPLIRHFCVTRAALEQPANIVDGRWTVCTPEAVAHFTAVGFFFARNIHQHLGVPIGIINSSWGGTLIESWMSEAALRSDPAFAVVFQRQEALLAAFPHAQASYLAAMADWKKASAAASAAGQKYESPEPLPPVGPGHRNMPMNLYNGMIAPLVPYALRGVLWYQGEANSDHPDEYQALFSALIRHWRRAWGAGDFPFYFVQLSSFKAWGRAAGEEWGVLREAQSRTLALPNTDMAVTIDIGDPDNVHPTNKQEVGRRLALIAKAKAYRDTDNYSGPVFESCLEQGNTLVLQFSHAEGLNSGGVPLVGFEIAGQDQKFVPAMAAIGANGSVIISAPTVARPVAARYAWSNAPVANFRNAAGLPAGTFRTPPRATQR